MNKLSWQNEDLPLEKRIESLISQMTVEEKVSQLTNSSAGIERLGVREYDWWNEALHGVARAGTATVFPQAIALASSWNTDLLCWVADAISTEARAKYNDAQREKRYDKYFGLTFWSPNINIFRDPRWGRGQETYGEDPYLTSRMGVAFIKGIQGNAYSSGESRHMKATACAKHYAVHSGPEGIRFDFNSVVGKKEIYETYLPAFEAAVKEAKVESVMGAYNAINGIPCCCNDEFQNKILRGDWGFEGHTVSDCGAILNISLYHHYAEDPVHAGAISLKNGCDLNCGSVYKTLIDAYEEDLICEEDLNVALRRILRARFKLGMFDKGTEYDDIPMSVVACKEHKELCLEATKEALVLLKNDGILPLKKDSIKTVALIGPNAQNAEVLLGNYNGTPTQYSTVYNALCEYIGTENVRYTKGCDYFGDEDDNKLTNAAEIAKNADVTILCLGLDASCEGEAGDASNPYASGDRAFIEMTKPQETLLRTVCEFTDKVIVVTMCGSAVAMNYADENANAIIHAWYPGELGGKAITELIFGEYSPSGKLPVTFYKATADLPDFSDYSMKNHTYRYFTGEVLYPFGYGLSYTSFVSRVEVVTLEDDKVLIKTETKNTGGYDGACVIKVFVREKDGLNQPIKSLKAFKKIFIKKGESLKNELTLDREAFSHINEDGEKEYLHCDKFEIITQID